MLFAKHINNISALQFFQLFRFGTLFLIGVVFTKSGLKNSEIGSYELLFTIGSTISFFWLTGLIQSFLPLHKNNEKSSDIFNAFILLSAFSVSAFFFLQIFEYQISLLSGAGGEIKYFKIFAWYILFLGPTSLIEYIYLLKNKSKEIIVYGIISYAVQFVFIVAPVLLYGNLEYSFYGLIIVSIARLVWVLQLIKKYSVFEFNKAFINNHISLATPLMISAVLSSSAIYINDFIVNRTLSPDVFAVYKYGSKQFPLIVLLASSFSNAMVPEIAGTDNLSLALKKIKEKSLKMMNYLFPIVVVLILTSKWIFPVLFNNSFQESYTVFNILLLLFISYMIFPQTILLGLKKSKVILIISGAELIIYVSMSLLLVRYAGIKGVALATVIAFVTERVLLVIACAKYLKISPAEYIPLKVYFAYSAMLVAAIVASMYF